MTLSELEAHFLKWVDSHHWQFVEKREDANGVQFLCPKCFAVNGGPVGTHSVICWSPEVSQDTSPGPGRWEMRGNGLLDLTLVAAQSSVQLSGGCNAHFFVENGAIKDA